MSVEEVKKTISNFWVKKYHPQTIDDLVLPTYIKNFVQKQVLITEDDRGADLSMMNILMVGTPGIGKTSITNVILKSLKGIDFLYLNASIDNGVDIVRNDLLKYVTKRSIKNVTSDKRYLKKVVWLEEADRLSPAFQESLRSFMEKYESRVRFILTGNSWNFSDALLDRFHSGVIDFDRIYSGLDKGNRLDIKKQMKARVEMILKNEGVEYEIQPVVDIINSYYPSLRSIISALNKEYIISGNVKVWEKSENINKVIHLIQKGNISQIRTYSHSVTNTQITYNQLVDYLTNGEQVDINVKMISNLLITIGKYHYQDNIVVDKKSNLFYLLIELNKLFKD